MKSKLLYLRLLLCKNGIKRAEYLKKHNIFYAMGDHCYFHPYIIPKESYLIKIHNNVCVAANVKFITHDIIDYMINYYDKTYEYDQFIGNIEICDSVFIGANSIIMPNVKIESNVVIAAGSVVTKNIPSGVIVGGNPAKIIGKFDDLLEKRKNINIPSKNDGIKKITDFYWKR